MSSKLDQLKSMTTVVADTGDIDAIRLFHPVDATTNPSLLLKAAQLPQYQSLVDQAIQSAEGNIEQACDRLAVAIGCEIIKLVPGRVSTEVDARLSFNTEAMIEKAGELIALYEEAGVDRSRILIKLASTWEGIRAAETLERMGINCNLTLLFCMSQAIACADAGVYLISPFVGRILDWYKASSPDQDFTGENDPGVISVSEIYDYYKQNNYETIVMGASFRNTGEIESLAGCDRLTISPALLEELQNDSGKLERRLDPETVKVPRERISLSEGQFRLMLNGNAMATEKLAEGIRNFIKDQIALEQLLKDRSN